MTDYSELVNELRSYPYGPLHVAADAIEALQKERDVLRLHVELLREKVSYDDCGCAVDTPHDVCLYHSPQVKRVAADNARLREACDQAACWFEEYGRSHTAKGDTDKANRNFTRAAACRAALEGK